MANKTWKAPRVQTVKAENLANQIRVAAWSWCVSLDFR